MSFREKNEHGNWGTSIRTCIGEMKETKEEVSCWHGTKILEKHYKQQTEQITFRCESISCLLSLMPQRPLGTHEREETVLHLDWAFGDSISGIFGLTVDLRSERQAEETSKS